MVVLSGCSAKFDGYDPSISAIRWVLTSGSKWKLDGMKDINILGVVDL